MIRAALFISLFALLATGQQGVIAQSATPVSGFDDASATITNPWLPLSSLAVRTYQGEETDEESGEIVSIRVEERLLPETKVIAGIDALIVEVTEYEDDELVEVTRDYYAQHPDGTVYYLGEDVDEYEDGEISGHGGAWLAGEGENQPGVFMLAEPRVGDVFEQERAPGVAEDRSTVVEMDVTVTVPAGDYSGCMKTEDVDPIGGVTEFKFYCQGVGLVREEFEGGFLDLISVETLIPATPAA